jgi:hypothetical protein
MHEAHLPAGESLAAHALREELARRGWSAEIAAEHAEHEIL